MNYRRENCENCEHSEHVNKGMGALLCRAFPTKVTFKTLINKKDNSRTNVLHPEYITIDPNIPCAQFKKKEKGYLIYLSELPLDLLGDVFGNNKKLMALNFRCDLCDALAVQLRPEMSQEEYQLLLNKPCTNCGEKKEEIPDE